MEWNAFWSAVLGSAVPSSLISLLMLYLTHRNNKAMEHHKQELQQDIIKFSQWHEKRAEALLTIYNAFCDYLDFIRRSLYVQHKDGRCMDPMHDFHRTIERQIVYLDDVMADKVHQYQGELLGFWNWLGLITKREPFSIIWREPSLASYFLSSSPRVAQDLSCSLSCSFRARRESAG